MNLEKIYQEEDLLPREITFWEEREYGFLFYNEDNKASYDSNHAVIFKNRIHSLNQVLDDIEGKPLLRHKFEIRRIVPYFFHCCKDFFFDRNIWGKWLSPYQFHFVHSRCSPLVSDMLFIES